MNRDRLAHRVRCALSVSLLLLAACARPLPLEPPALPGEPARRDVSVPLATPTAAARVPLVDEPIELESAPPLSIPTSGDPEADGTAAPSPIEIAAAPSPLAAIHSATDPRAAAAMRLAEEARVRMHAGDPDGAIEQLERAVSVDPQNGYVYYFLAEAHFRRRVYDQAILFADRSASLLAGRDEVWAGRSRALEGFVYETVGRFADARSAYERALRADPTNADARVGLARVGGTGNPR
jgi:Flp pilus assembly protein TadD